MMSKRHSYRVSVSWTGNRGTGTSGYRAYDRTHEVTAESEDEAHGSRGRARPQPIAGSSDPAFRGEPDRWNPEQLLTASLAQCHMLWYLHLCAVAGVVVTEYSDDATAAMTEDADGGGRFTEVVLRPHVTVSSPDMIAKANRIHRDAHEKCFIARSVNFPVRHEPVVKAPAGS
jgi:organic hydroperoxide reductase OsmC/OhrA